MNSKFAFLLSACFLMSSCSHDPITEDSFADGPSGKFSISSITTSPEMFSADTITRSTITIRAQLRILAVEDMNVQLTAGIQNTNGYHSSHKQNLRVVKISDSYFVSIPIPIDPFRLENPVFYLEAGESGHKPDIRITPLIPAVNTPPTSTIDSIIFSPSAGASVGSTFTMLVFASDVVGSGNISRVTVIGKRPDGTNQNPFDVPNIQPGVFQISLQIPAQTAQIGAYTWKFLVINKEGIPGKPVIRQYSVLP